MFEIIGFYFGILSKIFTIYLFLEIFPGVSYLAFISATMIMGFLLSFIFHNIKDEYDYKWKYYQQHRWQADIGHAKIVRLKRDLNEYYSRIRKARGD